MYSQVMDCHNGGPPLIRPLAEGKFHYLFGHDFLVAPIHEDKLARTVSLPPGEWRYLFNDLELLHGPAQVTRDFPLDEFPVFVRDGAVVPLKVARPYTGFGDKDSATFTTWLIYPQGKSEFTLWHPESYPKAEKTTVTVNFGESLRIGFAGKHEPHILRVFATQKPSAITLDGKNLLEGDAWDFDSKEKRVIIRTPFYSDGSYMVSWSQ
jgi:alpha-D-xyloside xylohydrolase